MYNQIFQKVIQAFINDYQHGIYNPITEADVQAYLFSLSREECIKQGLEQNIHLNVADPRFDPSKRKKIDLILNMEVAVEIKFEANYPNVSKPVVLSEEAAKDIERIKQMKENGITYCYFLFIDEDGQHFRNFHKHTSVSIHWEKVQRKSGLSYILFLSF